MRRLSIKGRLKKWLAPERYKHSLRVERAALQLADYYKADKEKAGIAALLHDCGRYVEGLGFLQEAKKFNLKIDDTERFQPKLLHAKLSKAVAKKVFKVRDKTVLSAIAKHTVGSSKMNMLEKIIYLADHIESQRRYPGVKTVRKLSFSDLDAAIAASTTFMLKDLLKKGLPVCEQTVKTRNYYLMRNYA